VLIQIPVFFALYKVLFVTIEMRPRAVLRLDPRPRGARTRPRSSTCSASPYNPGAVPVLGPFLMLGVWPIIMGITMWLQMKMNPEPPDPVQKQVFAWMPIIFTFMLGSFPAGLVIYWAWNNCLSIAQQYFIMRKNGVKVELWDNLRGTFGRRAPAKG
jgi:YidC/Oxa1 family membrane protein insertase